MLGEAREAGVVGEEGPVDLVPVQVDQVSGGVGHLVPVAGDIGRARAQLRGDVAVPVQGLVTGVTTRLVRQHVGGRGMGRAGLPVLHPRRIGAQGVALGAVHRDTYVICGLGVFEGIGIGGELLGFRGIAPEHLRDVDRGVLQLLVDRGHVTDVAAGPGERHPRRGGGGIRLRGGGRGGGRGRRVDHGRVRVVTGVRRGRGVEDGVGPVGEGTRRVRRPVGVVGLVAVADRHAGPVAVQPGPGGQQVISGVGDERGVVVGQERPVAPEEVQQVGHHLQVGRDVRVVAEEVDVVEAELDHVLDPVSEAAAACGAVVLDCGS